MNTLKPDFWKATVNGLKIGLLAVSFTIAVIIGGSQIENYRIDALRANSDAQVSVSEYYSTKEAEYICMFRHVCTERNKALYTHSLATCVALIIDCPEADKHGFYHVTARDTSDEVETFVKSNFGENLGDINIYVQEGNYPGDIALRNIYQALKKLGLENRIKYILQKNTGGPMSILIKNGYLYIPKERD